MAAETRDIKVKVTVDSDTKGSTEAAAGLEKVDASAGKAEKGFADLKKESESLDTQLAKTKTKLRELEQELVRTGDRTTGRGSLRQRVNQERAWLRELERLSKSAAEAGVSAGAKIDFSGAFSNLKGPLIAGLVVAAVAAAPAIGAIIGGAVAGTTVGGGIAGGVIAASNDSRVRAAFHDLTREFTAEAFGGGAFVAPVVAGLHILKDEFRDLNIDEALAKGASSVPILAQGIADLVGNTMPGFNAVMDEADSFTGVFAEGLSETGVAVSSLLSDLVESEGTIEGLAFGFKVLNGSIVVTGNVLGWLGDRFHDMAVIGAKFTGGMEDIVRGAENVARSTTQVLTFGLVNLDNNHAGSAYFADVNDSLEAVTAKGYGAGNSMAKFTDIIRDAEDPTEDQAAALKKVNDEFERGIDLQASYILNQLDVEQGLQDLADQFEENGNDLSSFTDEGRENQRALIDMAREMRQVRDDQIAMHMSTEEANAALEANKQRLYEQAEAAGFSRAEIEKLIGALFAVPTVTWRVDGQYNPEVGSRYGGKKAAGGGVSAGVSYLVGDGGKAEVFTPTTNGYISPSTAQWGANMGVPGGGSGQSITPLNLYGGGLGEVVFEWLRTEIAAKGGTLAVLGLRV